MLNFDSDSTLLQHMDELFLLPRCPVALPRAYWIDPERHVLSSQLVLIESSDFEFDRVMHAMQNKGANDFDMEIVNTLYSDSAMILPHRPYNMLTGEFRAANHTAYLGNDLEKWDPDAALAEAKFLHFSDWPVPKPWIETPDALREEKQPKCEADEGTGEEDCRARDIWLDLYRDFRERRRVRHSYSFHPQAKDLDADRYAEHMRLPTTDPARLAWKERLDGTGCRSGIRLSFLTARSLR